MKVNSVNIKSESKFLDVECIGHCNIIIDLELEVEMCLIE